MAIGRQMSSGAGQRRLPRKVLAASVFCVGAALAGGGVAGASASRTSSVQVLHFFSKAETMRFSTPSGKPFSPSKANPPAAGDVIESTDLDYLGNHSQHASSWSASDQLLCIVPAKGDPVCYAQIAIGGSMILLRGVATRTASTPFVVTGGTGRFKDVTGSLASVDLDPSSDSGNSDVTITLHRP
jgi:hypothetical protein